jgi:hypothetical protein
LLAAAGGALAVTWLAWLIWGYAHVRLVWIR